MVVTRARKVGALALALLLAASVPLSLDEGTDAAECTPVCDSCHYAHDKVYHAYIDITRFDVPDALDGADRKQVEVQLHLYGNVGKGYTTVSRGWLELTSNNDNVAIEDPRQDYVSFPPGYRSFSWYVTGRLEGTDTLHVQAYGLGVHLSVEFWESEDSDAIVVTNPVNAAPRVSFQQPDGYDDTADQSFQVGFRTEDPNQDDLLVDLYYDDDRNRTNGEVPVASSIPDPTTYSWNTRTVPDGTYYLHADVDDQRGGTAEATSKHPVIISHGNSVPWVELTSPAIDAIVHEATENFTWYAQDGDGDDLTFEFYVGRDAEHMELVAVTDEPWYVYAPPDNARLLWQVYPRDDRIRGWSRDALRPFTTSIEYPVEVELILPADGSVVAGPEVKLVWYGNDLDFQQVLYDVYLEHEGEARRIARDWDDPAGPVLVVEDLAPGETYTWWVVGGNPYSESGTSERWSFTVASDGAPGALLLGEEQTGGGVELEWAPDASAPPPALYDVHLVDAAGGDRLVLEGSPSTSLALDGLEEDATYRWYVVALDARGRMGPCTPAFRQFTYDTNAAPSASIDPTTRNADPGSLVLTWTTWDPDGDQVLCDVYLDSQNGTTLVAGDVADGRVVVEVLPDRIYTWRVVPRDLHGAGDGAVGTVLVGPAHSSVPVNGTLLSPPDGAEVTGPVVNLTWRADDIHGRSVLFDLYVTTASDSGSSSSVHRDLWVTSFQLEVAAGTEVTWSVRARALGAVEVLLGERSLAVVEGVQGLPVAALSVDGGAPGAAASVDALAPVALSANGSLGVMLDVPLEFWFDYGDGRASGWLPDPNAEHAYLVEGTYNVTLTVRQGDLESEAAVVAVTVGPGDKTADDEVPAAGPALSWCALLLAAAAIAIRRRRGCA